jgi:4-hydroxy-2-oxoheptanedioate aldolase
MRKNTILEKFKNREPIVNAWLSIPSSYSAEVIAHTGVDSVTVDMQHGMVGFSDVMHMLQAISTSSSIPLVRVPAVQPDVIMKILDAGAYGIICPSVDTPELCKTFVDSCRYPPLGIRSFGPTRGITYGGADYIKHANTEIAILAMIESQEAIDNLSAILNTDGLTGIYIGPNDLSYSLEGMPGLRTDKVERAIEYILSKAKEKGLFTGIFCANAEEALERMEQGFDLITPGNDAGVLRNAYNISVEKIKGTTLKEEKSTGY